MMHKTKTMLQDTGGAGMVRKRQEGKKEARKEGETRVKSND